MDKKQILSVIYDFSFSQGFYGRLYEFLTDGSEDADCFMQKLVDQNFNDTLDLILYLEQ